MSIPGSGPAAGPFAARPWAAVPGAGLPGPYGAGLPGPGGSARRPVPVVLAAAILSVMAAVGLAYAITGLASVNGIVDRFRAATGAESNQSAVDTTIALLWGAQAIAVVVAVVVGVVLIVLALGILRGGNRARLITWLACALGLFGGCGGLAAVVVQRAVPWTFSPDDRAAAELLGALTGAYPSWWIGLGAGLSVAQALGYLVVAVLLALPSLTAVVDRRPTAGGQPSVPNMSPTPLM